MTDSNTIVSWGFILRGDPLDMATMARIFASVPGLSIERKEFENENVEYHLRSARFDGIATAEEAQGIGSEILASLVGALKVFGEGKPVTLGNVFGICSNGSRIVSQECGARSRAVATLEIAVDGVLQPPQPVPTEPTVWLEIAERDNNVADALQHYARSDDWFDIYKVLEVVRADVGGEAAMTQKEWASKTKIDLLRQTANYYRHARTPRPISPMLHNEACSLVRHILRHWLKEKQRP